MLYDLWHSWPSAIAAASILASGIILVLAAGHDIASRTVPNWMSAAIACFGVAASVADNRALVSIACGLVIFVASAFCWRRGWMGGADVKLLGAIAIVLPPGVVSTFVLAMAAAGAVHAIAYMLAGRVLTPPAPAPAQRLVPRSLFRRALRAERWRISRHGPLPYACAIAFGFLFVICHGAAP
jgi:prepilin peptidase CpaA